MPCAACLALEPPPGRRKARPNPDVVSWIESTDDRDLHLCEGTLGKRPTGC